MLTRAKHWLEHYCVAPLFRFLFRRNVPTDSTEALAAQFQRELDRTWPATAATRQWRTFCEKLREEAGAQNVRQFLHWPTIRLTMFGADRRFIGEEIRYLKRQPDWRTRWKPALREDRFGGPVPSRYYLRSSSALIHQAHHLAAFEDEVGRRIDTFSVIVEFGGGYGSMCRLVRRMGFSGTYVIYDLPPFTALQRLFLHAVGWATEPLSEDSELEPQRTYLCFDQPTMLQWLDKKLVGSAPPGRLFIATWSLSETPAEQRQPFVDRLSKFSSALIAYQGLFEGVDNDRYFRDLERRLPSWRIAHVAIPGMAAEAGIYWIGRRFENAA